LEHFFDTFRDKLNIGELDVRTYSPLSLAYIGDSIYDVLVKLYLVGQGNRSVNQFHKLSKNYIKASEQARILKAIEHMLTEEELKIVKRGRNAKSRSVPKNANLNDYQLATGFECLLGYHMINRDYDRIIECVVEGINHD